MNTRNWVIIHHTASFATDSSHQYDAVNRYHKDKGWGMIGYHYFLERDGTVKKGREEWQTGAHTYQWAMNYRSIGICLAGDFDKQDPSKAQLDALYDLLTDVQLRNGIRDGHIKLHREFAHYKSCPGTRVSREFVNSIIFSRGMRKRIVVKPQPDLDPVHE